MRTMVIGDIHGNYKALMQVFERSRFDYKEDHLIVLGDVCDGWPDVKQCIEELLKVKKITYILGNHDDWARTYYSERARYGTAYPDYLWTSQGGQATLQSYDLEEMPKSHLTLLTTALYYYEDEYNGRVYVHAGIDPNQRVMSRQDQDILLWDRQLVKSAWAKRFQKPDYKFGGWNEIFVGHTTTQWFKADGTEPLNMCNVWNLDTGAGWSGKLTIMNADTKTYWQSDLAKELYPDAPGRR